MINKKFKPQIRVGHNNMIFVSLGLTLKLEFLLPWHVHLSNYTIHTFGVGLRI